MFFVCLYLEEMARESIKKLNLMYNTFILHFFYRAPIHVVNGLFGAPLLEHSRIDL